MALFISLVLISCSLQAQDFELTSVNLRVQNGLAGDNVYCALQDDKGYIWFGTETGVSRYNGRTFENFYMSDGLADNEIFRIDQDSQGRIWFSAFNGQMSYYHKGQFFNKSNSPMVAAIKFETFYHNLFEDSQGNVWFATKLALAMVAKDGTVKNTEDFAVNKTPRIATFIEKDGAVWGATGFDRVAHRFPINGDMSKADSVVLKGEFADFITANPAYLPSGLALQASTYIKTLIDDENQIATSITKIHNYPNDEAWACTYSGALKIDKANRTHTVFFEDKQVSHVLRDREGGYWFTTFGDGVLYVPSLEKSGIGSINNQPIGNITALLMQGDVLWFGGNKAVIGKIGADERKRWSLSLKGGRSRVKKIIPMAGTSDILFVAEEAMVLKNEDNSFSRLTGSVKLAQPWSDSLLVVGATHVVYVFDLKTMLKRFKTEGSQANDSPLATFQRPAKPAAGRR